MSFSVNDFLLIAQVGVEVINLAVQAEADGREVTPEEMATVFTNARNRMDAADKRFDQAVADHAARQGRGEPPAGG